jgi:hypothetical protein
VRTRLTVLTQNSRSSSGQEIAAATSKFDHEEIEARDPAPTPPAPRRRQADPLPPGECFF